MRLLALTAVVMVAFAANSVLNRAALAGGGIGAAEFGTVRLAAGAAMLAICVLATGRGLRLGGPGRVAGVAALLAYIYGFSFAYEALDAGVGALILFGMVQVTMFAAALLSGERPPARRWLGAGLAFGGLVWLLWPGETTVSLPHGALMAAAGVGWGVYSVTGRGAGDALGATAANFLLAAPLGVALLVGVQGGGVTWDGRGMALAVVSGAVTSGLDYALWYSVLPRLAGSVAAVAQLTVPVVAMAGGMALLGEAVTGRFLVAAVVVLGGVGLSVVRWGR